MKKIIAATTLASLLAAPSALAGEGKTFSSIDTNADGYLSLAEVQAVKPSVTAETFAAYDTDADAQISEAEFEAMKAKKEERKDKMDSTDTMPQR